MVSALFALQDSHICCLEKEVTVLQDKLLQAQEDLTKSHGLDLDSCVQYSAGAKDKRKLSNEVLFCVKPKFFLPSSGVMLVCSYFSVQYDYEQG